MGIEHLHVEAVGFVDHLPCLLPVGGEVHIGPLPLIFATLTINRVVREVAKALLQVIHRVSTHRVFHSDIGLHPTLLCELDDAMDLFEPHPMIQVEFEVAVGCHVILLVQEVVWKYRGSASTSASH